jgi:Domain of unknown function (DUF4331)
MTESTLRAAGGVAVVATIVSALVFYSGHAVRGSDHQDSPTVVNHVGADISDVYVFPPNNANRDRDVVLVMNVHPIITHAQLGTTFFDPAVMYQLKIAHGASTVEDQVIQFKAGNPGANQSITLYGPAKPHVTGTKSVFIAPAGSATIDTPVTLPNGIQFFAGHRADPFFFDLARFLMIIPDRNAGFHNPGPPPAPTAGSFRGFTSAFNTLHGASCDTSPSNEFLSSNGLNVLTLVVELPRSMLTTTSPLIHVWATTSTTSGS